MSIEIMEDGNIVAMFSSKEVTEMTVTHQHGHTRYIRDAEGDWENVPLDDQSWILSSARGGVTAKRWLDIAKAKHRDLMVIPLNQEMLEFLRDQATDEQAGVLAKQALRRSPIKRIVDAEAKG